MENKNKKLNITLCYNNKGESYYKVSRKNGDEWETLGYASHIYEFKNDSQKKN